MYFGVTEKNFFGIQRKKNTFTVMLLKQSWFTQIQVNVKILIFVQKYIHEHSLIYNFNTVLLKARREGGSENRYILKYQQYLLVTINHIYNETGFQRADYRSTIRLHFNQNFAVLHLLPFLQFMKMVTYVDCLVSILRVPGQTSIKRGKCMYHYLFEL